MNAVPVSERRSVWLIFGLVIAAFILGSAGGYAVRAASVPISVSTQRIAADRLTAPCPPGSHPVVWYTARAWACSSETQADSLSQGSGQPGPKSRQAILAIEDRNALMNDNTNR